MVSKLEVASVLDRLNGQIATPPGASRHVIEYIVENGLAMFREWPSGHWQVTEAGRYFRAEHYVDSGEDDDQGHRQTDKVTASRGPCQPGLLYVQCSLRPTTSRLNH
jgi:hypothetical protein